MPNQNTVGTMRQGSNPKGRSRGRGSNSKKGSPIRTGSFDGAQSTRVRGNAHQLMDKYLALARDASSSGDRVLAENYFQHADHYYRVIGNTGRVGPRQSVSQATPAAPNTDEDLEEQAREQQAGEGDTAAESASAEVVGL